MQDSVNSRIPWRIRHCRVDAADDRGRRGHLHRGACVRANHTALADRGRHRAGWLVWILFTPAIFWLGARIRVLRPMRALPLVAHLVLSIVIGLVHAAVVAACMEIFEQRDGRRCGSLRRGRE